MPENHVLMSNGGSTIRVHPHAVKDHQRLGWAVIQESELTPVGHANLHQRIRELEGELESARTRIAELEAKLAEQASEPPADDDLKARIAELEAKKAAGTMAKHEHALLGRFQSRLAKQEGKA